MERDRLGELACIIQRSFYENTNATTYVDSTGTEWRKIANDVLTAIIADMNATAGRSVTT